MTATVVPIPFLRGWFREAMGIVLSGDEYPEHTRDTARRFLRGLTDDTRRLLTRDLMTSVPDDGDDE